MLLLASLTRSANARTDPLVGTWASKAVESSGIDATNTLIFRANGTWYSVVPRSGGNTYHATGTYRRKGDTVDAHEREVRHVKFRIQGQLVLCNSFDVYFTYKLTGGTLVWQRALFVIWTPKGHFAKLGNGKFRVFKRVNTDVVA